MRGEFNNQYSGEEMNDRMNGWKEEAISPADTYIEWRFETKCKQLSDGFRIITEWRKRKLQYVAVMKTIAMDFQHYSRHDVTHSICILETIEKLLGKQRVDLLSAGDLWLLLEAAYSHDIGMALTYDQMSALWQEDENFQQFIQRCIEEDIGDVSRAALYYKEIDNLLHDKTKMGNFDGKEEFIFSKDWPLILQYYIHILTAEYIRQHHTKRVNDLFQKMDQETETIIPPRLYQVVISVSQMHGGEFSDILKQLKYCTDGFGNGVLHPQFAAAMLRMGDLLDIDNNRFDPYAIRHFGRLPLASILHEKKHSAITHIHVAEAEIAAEADTTEYEVAILTDEWFQMIQKEVTDLICTWNEIVPEALQGCVLKKSNCKVLLNHHAFDSDMKKEFSVNKKKIINLLIGTNIYNDPLDFIREYLQNAMDASKMHLWIDLKSGKYDYDSKRNLKILDHSQISPFDLDSSVYDNYTIIIQIEWNEQKDKVRVQIIDNGIGIEKEYFDKLSNIGTGWKGRKLYKEEIYQMAKWLQPTGGFGIGVQSAFMVTDSVELLTKSVRDAQRYKVLLMSPDKGGNISIEYINNKSLSDTDGTVVTFELEPEKFQGWMERQKKQYEQNYKFVNEQPDYSYDLNNWDEFDPDGILMYVQKFFYNYIRTVIPNPLFPIEIKSSVTNGKIYRNQYWPDTNYWKNPRKNFVEERTYEGNRYLGIFEEERKFFLVWNKTDCVLTRISKQGKDRLACFKNVLVNEKDDTLLNLFCKYSICIDFMGFHVDNYLKLHRNSFQEKFHWEQYCYEGFRMYLHFLREQSTKQMEIIKEQCRTFEKNSCSSNTTEMLKQNNIIAEWLSYPLQLLRMVAFYDMFDDPYRVLEDAQNTVHVQKYVADTESPAGINADIEQVSIDGNLVLKILEQYYEKMNNFKTIAWDDGAIPAILLDSAKQYTRKDDEGIAIHPNKTRQWLGTGVVSDDSDGKITTILNTMKNGIGVITDIDTIDMLLSDSRLYTRLFSIGGTSIRCFFLAHKEENVTICGQSFFSYFWQKSDCGRKYVTGKSTDKYPQLRITELPFRSKNNRSNEVYLLSPISNSAYDNIKRLQKNHRKLSYEEFRAQIWGERGNESPEYHMLIDWVVKHQEIAKQYTQENISKTYVVFLKALYEECLYEP